MYQVSFLPWISFSESISIGPIKFWPYYSEAEKLINDPEIRQHLDKYFKRHVDNKGEPVDTITICSYGDIDFRQLNDSELIELRNSVNALAFATIAPIVENAVSAKNKYLGPPTSDTFELATQNFYPGTDDIAVRAGSLLSTGLKIDEITFSKPWATGGMVWPPSRTLLEGFDNCLSAAVNPTIQQRIFRSLEWFVMAHLENSPVSPLAKVVMLGTAFEVLLQFNGTKWGFVNYIEDNIATDDFFKDTRPTRKGDRTLSLAGCWAWDFYELRSRIVHGEAIQPEEFMHKSEWSHSVVANVIFLECIKRVMLINKCIGEETSQGFLKVWPDLKEAELLNLTSILVLGFSGVHKALGWIGKDDREDDK